ncbi:MAG: rhodanese-like domain-containing protein, partial [Calditrichia bacterium]
MLTFLVLAGCGQTSAGKLNDEQKKERIQSMYESYKEKSFPDAPGLTAQDYLKLNEEEKIILIDVREKKEMEVSVIPGAITRDEFEDNKDKYRDYKVVSYCTIGYRSGKYTRKLVKEKFDAYNLVGGVLSWAHAGQKFAAPDGDSLQVHVYGDDWDLLPVGYKSV